MKSTRILSGAAAALAFGARRAQALLEELDAWLAARDTDNPPDDPDAARVRLGMGIYYFEAPADLGTPKE